MDYCCKDKEKHGNLFWAKGPRKRLKTIGESIQMERQIA
jgi:hypothetical protein